MNNTKPHLTVLGGVNGAGKSTIRDRYIQPNENAVVVIDPDRLSKNFQAQGVDKILADRQGGREAIALFETAISEKKDIFLETTLSGHTIFKRYDKAKMNDYEITTIYVGLEQATDHKNRVKNRVLKGGHFIAEETIETRFNQAQAQLEKAFSKSHNFKYYNNMDVMPILSFEKIKNLTHIVIYDNTAWTNTIAAKLGENYNLAIVNLEDNKNNMKLSDFDYNLPENLIARFPLAQRSASRLLYLPNTGNIQDLHFTDLPDLLNQGDLIVFNDTKVMKARLFGKKDTGGAVEVLVERILQSSDNLTNTDLTAFDFSQKTIALCHVCASKAPKIGQTLLLGKTDLVENPVKATLIGREENLFILQFDQPILPILEQYGELPIPPYFERQADDNDETRYQTVFHDPAKLASVAAPTASLHFDDAILQRLKNKGVNTAFVTLHVGAGTFMPVKTDDIFAHKMHSEYGELPQATADLINQTKAQGGKIIAVGTTVTRLLETAFLSVKSGEQHQLSAWQGDTDIFIYPSFEFGVIDKLVTNFHLPKSTLLMLVSAFIGTDIIKTAYQHAIEQQYRFFSYGDAMLLDKVVK